MNLKTEQYLRELDQQFLLVEQESEDEIRSLLANYLCIRTSGLLETFIKGRISDYIDKKAPKEVKRYIATKMKDITSLNAKKIVSVLDAFSNTWSTGFQLYIDCHEQEKNSLNSIVANRHNIAHGQNSRVTFANMKQYYTDIKGVIAELDKIIK